MTDQARHVSADAARRFLVTRHLLAPPRASDPSPEGVMAVFGRLGSVQFDPLSVAGRNHDLVLHARVRDYDRRWTERLLYERRELYETYNKGLSLLPTSELPWYRVFWDAHAVSYGEGIFTSHPETVEHVVAEIRRRGPLSTLDFERGQIIDWDWGPTSLVRAALEALDRSGVLGLARREGNRRYYDLVERLFPAALLSERHDRRDQHRHKLLSRYRGGGLLGTGGQAELWLGAAQGRLRSGDAPDTPLRDDLRQELIDAGSLTPVRVEGVKGTRYVISEELPILDGAEREEALPGPPSVTLLAPLDPLVWDRDLLRQLFDFDYLWEVYVPEHKRRWGYYVLPILFGDRLVGRFEPRIDRRAGVMRVLGAWWETGFDPRTASGFVEAMRDALAAYLRFGDATRVEWAPALGRERRIFGTRPSAPARTAA